VCVRVCVCMCTQERVMSRIKMSHVAHRNESCHTRKWVTSHTEMRHDAHNNESWLVAHRNESRHTWEVKHIRKWVTSHTEMRHDTYRNESYRTYKQVMAYLKGENKSAGISQFESLLVATHAHTNKSRDMSLIELRHITNTGEPFRT